MPDFSFLSSALSLSRFRFQLCAEDSFPKDFYLGSTLRGALGWQIQRLVCPFEGRKKCDSCLVANDCPYYELYLKKSDMPGLMDSPRGYVFYVSPDSEPGLISLDITLFGSCTRFAPVLSEAILRAARTGLTRRRIGFCVRSMQQLLPEGSKYIDPHARLSDQLSEPLPLYAWMHETGDARVLDFSLITPLRLRKNGHYLNYLDMDFFLQNILRRMESLGCVFGSGRPLGKENWDRLKEQILPAEVHRCDSPQDLNGSGFSYYAKTSWDDYKRYSNRQGKKVPMGGIVGDVRLKGADETVLSLLRTAELLHVGKGAALGLGRVEIQE